jgi:hypothetical protein
MAYRRTIEKNYENIVMAVYAEDPDNANKANAVSEVAGLVNEGALVYKVETLDGIFVGVQVINNDEVLYSKFRH